MTTISPFSPSLAVQQKVFSHLVRKAHYPEKAFVSNYHGFHKFAEPNSTGLYTRSLVMNVDGSRFKETYTSISSQKILFIEICYRDDKAVNGTVYYEKSSRYQRYHETDNYLKMI